MTRLVDDIDGSHAVTTLSFSLDGHSYEIDLSESHLSALQQALAPFVTAARAVPGGRRPERAPAPTEPATKAPVAKSPAAKAPAPQRTPAPNGRVAPARDTVATKAAAARPTAVESTGSSTGNSAVDAQPFQQAGPGREGTARSKPERAPLVANPFKPQS